jgi:hypothetical protein
MCGHFLLLLVIRASGFRLQASGMGLFYMCEREGPSHWQYHKVVAKLHVMVQLLNQAQDLSTVLHGFRLQASGSRLQRWAYILQVIYYDRLGLGVQASGMGFK